MTFIKALGILAGGVLVYFLVSIVIAMTGPRGYEGVIGGLLAIIFVVYMFMRKPKTA